MNRQTYIQIGDDVLPIDRNDYDIDFVDVETVRTTELGTDSYEIIREGKLVITTNVTVTKDWYAILRAYKATPVLTVKWYNPGTGTTETATMKMTQFHPHLVMDSSSRPVFAIAITLREY